jgi:hypothetical protein
MLEQREACKAILKHFECRTDTIVGAELGVCLGSNAESLLHNIPNLHLYLIDNERSDIWVTEDVGYEECIHKGGKFPLGYIIRDVSQDKITWNLKRTDEAVKDYPDLFFDFVYVDADHAEPCVKKDCNDWWPKVKMGGIICGHDYNEPSNLGVTHAVNEVFRERVVHCAPNKDDGVQNQRYIYDWWVFK